MDASSPAIYTEVLVFTFLLFMSGFFSSSEVVFFGANRYLLKLRERKRIYGALLNLLSKPGEVLLTILLGNELVNILISSYGTKLFVELFGPKGAGFAVLFSSTLIFLFGEVLPKNVVLPFTTRLAPIYYLPFLLIHRLTQPLRLLLIMPVRRLTGVLEVEGKVKEPEEVFTELLEMGLSLGYFEARDLEVVERAMKLKETTVKEIMTPKPDIFMLSDSLTLEEALEEIVQRKHSKVPLFSESHDHITGILYVKDLTFSSESSRKRLKEFKREALFVPEILSITELVKEMRNHGTQIAVVVGEHGELSGLVSLYDIMRYLFGDVPESWEEDIIRVSKDTYLVNGWVDVERVATKIGFNLPEDYEYDTIGGFVMAMLSKVPEEGDQFIYDGFKFVVDKMEGNRIVNIFVTLKEEERE
ncbi:MAG: hemolysin family protein [Aquificaceae bacterium]|nr:hemolysin family protein [Aquificaceae bacterium]MDW8032199.1 hemolysin family protein [Aquificaceae bacterium]MDW8294172.1 hemolysin family protein [Aquificaceae bacterium]